MDDIENRIKELERKIEELKKQPEELKKLKIRIEEEEEEEHRKEELAILKIIISDVKKDEMIKKLDLLIDDLLDLIVTGGKNENID